VKLYDEDGVDGPWEREMARMALYVMDFEGQRAWKVKPSLAWIKANDNGHLVSIGLVLGADVSWRKLRRWLATGFAKRCDYQEANHSACQSSCVKRGGKECRW